MTKPAAACLTSYDDRERHMRRVRRPVRDCVPVRALSPVADQYRPAFRRALGGHCARLRAANRLAMGDGAPFTGRWNPSKGGWSSGESTTGHCQIGGFLPEPRILGMRRCFASKPIIGRPPSGGRVLRPFPGVSLRSPVAIRNLTHFVGVRMALRRPQTASAVLIVNSRDIYVAAGGALVYAIRQTGTVRRKPPQTVATVIFTAVPSEICAIC